MKLLRRLCLSAIVLNGFFVSNARRSLTKIVKEAIRQKEPVSDHVHLLSVATSMQMQQPNSRDCTTFIVNIADENLTFFCPSCSTVGPLHTSNRILNSSNHATADNFGSEESGKNEVVNAQTTFQVPAPFIRRDHTILLIAKKAA